MNCLQGYITASYDTLVEVFGEPTYGPEDSGDGKVSTEWEIGTVRLYDWKEESADVCRQGEYKWHIGGMSDAAVAFVENELFEHFLCSGTADAVINCELIDGYGHILLEFVNNVNNDTITA